jgi:hypothetical protein
LTLSPKRPCASFEAIAPAIGSIILRSAAPAGTVAAAAVAARIIVNIAFFIFLPLLWVVKIVKLV